VIKVRGSIKCVKKAKAGSNEIAEKLKRNLAEWVLTGSLV